MDKELALAIDFKKAPKELQDAATAHYANVKALNKLRQRLIELNKEIEAGVAVSEKSEKILRVALKSWTPEV